MPYIGAGLTRFNTADELTVTGDAEFNANANFGDNDKIQLGASQDLQIYHDGSHSRIADEGNGRLTIETNGDSIRLTKGTSENMLIATPDGSVELYHDNAAKLATKSDGVDITGELQADSLDIDGAADISGTLSVAGKIEHTGDTDTFINFLTNEMRFNIGGTANLNLTSTGLSVNEDSVDMDFRVESNGNANMLVVDGGNNSVGIGLAAGSQEAGAFLHSGGQCLFQHNHTDTSSSGNVSYLAGNQALTLVNAQGGDTDLTCKLGFTIATTGANTDGLIEYGSSGAGSGEFRFYTEASNTIAERMRIDSGGSLTIPGGDTSPQDNSSGNGICLTANGEIRAAVGSSQVADLNRMTNDGTVILIRGQGVAEGSIEVNGSTVSLNGGHLSRWSQTTDGQRISGLLRGTVMTNLDQMAVWSHDATEAQDAVFDDDGNIVTEAVEARDAYTEDNEQLNCMAVSSVEGDANVAGVFQNWDEDDDFNDMLVALTGDFIIRIASGTTVARGDLLMSAGDGTAKPQGDDIVRSKTIAKVTSTNVSHTYDDGSYLVPCVLMAC